MYISATLACHQYDDNLDNPYLREMGSVTESVSFSNYAARCTRHNMFIAAFDDAGTLQASAD